MLCKGKAKRGVKRGGNCSSPLSQSGDASCKFPNHYERAASSTKSQRESPIKGPRIGGTNKRRKGKIPSRETSSSLDLLARSFFPNLSKQNPTRYHPTAGCRTSSLRTGSGLPRATRKAVRVCRGRRSMAEAACGAARTSRSTHQTYWRRPVGV